MEVYIKFKFPVFSATYSIEDLSLRMAELNKPHEYSFDFEILIRMNSKVILTYSKYSILCDNFSDMKENFEIVKSICKDNKFALLHKNDQHPNIRHFSKAKLLDFPNTEIIIMDGELYTKITGVKNFDEELPF